MKNRVSKDGIFGTVTRMPIIEGPGAGLIRESRKRFGFTQAAAAELVGVTVSTWERYEAGTRNMRSGTWMVFIDRIQDFARIRDLQSEIRSLEEDRRTLLAQVRDLAAIQDVEAPEIAEAASGAVGAVGWPRVEGDLGS